MSGGWAVLGVEHVSRLVVRQRRPEEDDDRRGHVSRSARRREPGTAGATLSVQPSSPGTTIRTTGTPTSGRVRSTRIACPMPAAAQPVELVRHVVVDRLSGTCATSSNARQTVRGERPRVRPDRAGVLHPAVEGGWAVVAAARDQRQPALRRLGQRARESDGAVGMAAASGRGGQAPENVAPPVDDRRGEDRQLDVRRQVPRDDADIGALVGLEQLPAARIGHAVEIDADAPPGRTQGARPTARTRRARPPRKARGSPPRAGGSLRRDPCRLRGSTPNPEGRASGSRDGRTRTAPRAARPR